MARNQAVRRETVSATRKTTRRSKRIEDFDEPEAQPQTHYEGQRSKINRQPLEPQTETQRRYINAINNFVLTIATGPAGSGKSYCAGTLAAEALTNGDVEKIIITRPAVEAGESLGFLPGELEEKFGPYLQPFRDVLEERLGKSQVEMFMKNGKIDARPLAYMRGATFKNAFVILDEAQNTTPTQMKMFLTRIGHGCKVVVNGDMQQCDIRGMSGLQDAVRRVTYIPSVKHITFTKADIVRSGLVSEIVVAYDLTEAELLAMRPNVHP